MLAQRNNRYVVYIYIFASRIRWFRYNNNNNSPIVCVGIFRSIILVKLVRATRLLIGFLYGRHVESPWKGTAKTTPDARRERHAWAASYPCILISRGDTRMPRTPYAGGSRTARRGATQRAARTNIITFISAINFFPTAVSVDCLGPRLGSNSFYFIDLFYFLFLFYRVQRTHKPRSVLFVRSITRTRARE